MADQTSTIPNGWKMTTLGEVAIFNYGKGLNTENRIDGKIPVYGSSGITGHHNKPLIEEGGYIIGRKGTVGSIHYSSVPFFPIDTVYYLSKKDIKTDFRFFYFLLRTLNLDKLNFDSAVPGLNREMAYSLKCLIPEQEEEQRAIAAVLSSLDDKIELLRDQNKTLEATAQAIFKEWFVNFNFPGATGKTIDSELGKIPEGWRVGKLGEEFKIEYGKSDKNFDADGLHPVYGAGGIVGYSNFADYRDYQVIIGCRGTCGNITLAYEDSKITHNSLIISSDWFKPFIYLYLHSVDIGKAITGSTQPQITIGDLDNIEILIPQNKIVSTFVEIIAPIFKKKGNNNSQIQTLATFRDALLPKLMKGELRVNGFID